MAQNQHFDHTKPSLSWKYCTTALARLQQKHPAGEHDLSKTETKNRLLRSGTNKDTYKNSTSFIIAVSSGNGGVAETDGSICLISLCQRNII